MPKGILGRKHGMTQVFEDDGSWTPVTVIEAGPCQVVQKKTKENDGYEAVQVSFGDVKPKNVNKPMRGHFARAGVPAAKKIKELRIEDSEEMQGLSSGDLLELDIFNEGDYVDVTGVTKGKGFAGVIKRWGFHRGPMTRGSKYHRRTGSLGATDPARVFKGRKMPGRMGGNTRTIQALRIVKVDKEKNLLLLAGSVPGPKGTTVLVRKTAKDKKRRG